MTESDIFKQAVIRHAKFMDWDTSEGIEDDFAGFSFELEENNEIDISFFLNEDRIDIAVSGKAIIESEEDLPDDFSTLLMRRSDDLMYGAWTLAETEDGEMQYRLLWTVELEYFDKIKSEKLQELVELLIDEASEVNKIWDEGPF